MLEGLSYLHAQGIIFGDLKPSNVLMNEYCKLKLCDFGLCADVSSGENLTDFVGSPGFFAPELLLAKSYCGKRADVWSLGCVMLEMLLGHEVFTNLWCPPYDHLHDDEAFRDAVSETVLQVKLGSTQCAPSPALRTLRPLLRCGAVRARRLRPRRARRGRLRAARREACCR